MRVWQEMAQLLIADARKSFRYPQDVILKARWDDCAGPPDRKLRLRQSEALKVARISIWPSVIASNARSTG